MNNYLGRIGIAVILGVGCSTYQQPPVCASRIHDYLEAQEILQDWQELEKEVRNKGNDVREIIDQEHHMLDFLQRLEPQLEECRNNNFN